MTEWEKVGDIMSVVIAKLTTEEYALLVKYIDMCEDKKYQEGYEEGYGNCNYEWATTGEYNDY